MNPTQQQLSGMMGQLGQAQQMLNNIQPQVSAGQLSNPTTNVSVPQPSQPVPPSQFVNNLEPAIQSGSAGVQNLQNQIITAQTNEASQRNDVLNRLLDMEGLNSQGTFNSAFNSNLQSITGQDPDAFMQQLGDANTALATLQGKFRTGKQAVSSAQGQSQVFEGVQLNEMSRQEAVEVGNQALLVQAMQGNFDTARQIALDTANFASQDKKVELDNLLAQYDALTGIVDQQTQQLLDQEKTKIEAEKAQIERTQNLVDNAIVAGMATVEEMQYLTSTEVSDTEKQRIAMEIINKGGRADRAFANQKAFGSGDDVSTTLDAQNQLAQLGFLKETASSALDLVNVSGSSKLNQKIRNLFKGSNKFNQLENFTTTLKTNVLSLAVDPNVKKFFGPQMSEADVRMMMAGGTTLDPNTQTPAQMKKELERVQNLFSRIESAMPAELKGVTGQTQQAQQVMYQGQLYNVSANGDMTLAN